ncbi:MAG TPA: carbamoyltransferase [Bacteroidales bacterium]|nr:carbamoyltransferase [Bacteroidales bacterium]
MKQAILGISAYYHDSAAALIVDGEIIAAAQEERFTRKKHDPSFPQHAIRYVLEESDVPFEKLSAIVFYEKPWIKFERLLETYHAFTPGGLVSFVTAIPVWIREKLFQKNLLKKELAKFGIMNAPLLFPEHHLSHAASAFYPSPFSEATIITVDGVGEWATATIGKGNGATINVLKELQFPHSPGLLYSAFTYYCGFRVNSGEYKLMGLAPYGNPNSKQTREFYEKIRENLVDIRDDGSILLNMDYFRFATGMRTTRDKKWKVLFGIPPRKPEAAITQDHMNLALAIQLVTEEIMINLATHAKEITGCRNLVLAGGVALNCVANARLQKTGLFDEIWVQPASGDAGGAVGGALAAWHIYLQMPRIPVKPDGMKGALLGPSFGCKDITRVINRYHAVAEHYTNDVTLCSEVALLIKSGNVIGWFQGRMEYGPRALGNRSILGDPGNTGMQKRLNLKIKYREGFRPFAPAVLEEDLGQFFDMEGRSPYMLFVAPVKKHRRYPEPPGYQDSPLAERLYHIRSDIPAVTHIDYSARLQTVSREVNPLFHQLISEFKKLTQYGMLINTSFNVRGEPIVCSPDDAYRCFMSTEMDYLVLGNYLFDKTAQPERPDWIYGSRSID